MYNITYAMLHNAIFHNLPVYLALISAVFDHDTEMVLSP